jgi:ABC-type amino acid transport substrate-binding protein
MLLKFIFKKMSLGSKWLYCCLTLSLISTPTWAQTVIRIGGYDFAPYVTFNNNTQATGLSLDLIAALNAIQTEVKFEFVGTSIEQRYQAFSKGRYDAIFFESREWGWQDYDTQFIPLGIEDGERYISLIATAKDQSYFDDFQNKKLALVSGYHYKFAQWSNDPKVLEAKFDPLFVPSNKASIESVLKARADIAPVTWSYLQHYFVKTPAAREKLLFSTKWDQQYQHGIIINPKSSLSAEQLSLWLEKLKQNGTLKNLAQRYHLTVK